jgi:hypothetical protein
MVHLLLEKVEISQLQLVINSYDAYQQAIALECYNAFPHHISQNMYDSKITIFEDGLTKDVLLCIQEYIKKFNGQVLIEAYIKILD